jgi:signal transduction histidine kinase
MSAKVSHEVRNPLSSISLNVELLEDEVAAIPAERRNEVARLLGAVRSQVDVLSAVTEEYLRSARVPRPKRELCALQSIIVDLVDFVREELRARKVELLVKAPEILPALRVDPAQIRQVLLNLIRNAAEAMPEGGPIRFETRLSAASGGSEEDAGKGVSGVSPPACVEITVTDNGVGIPMENREKVFEPFFTSKDGGTGLGLAISREIALGHGGTLRCESTPGNGTTFCLVLPIIDEEPQR